MKRQSRVPIALMNELLLSIIAFMRKTGMSIQEIDCSFQSCRKRLERPAVGVRQTARTGLPIGCDTVAGAILRAWHRDPKYLTEEASPKPLSVGGRTASLKSLIRSQDPSAHAPQLVAAMMRTGLIRRDRQGCYLPTRSAATIGQMHPFAVDHVAKTVMRLVETVDRNVQLAGKRIPLIERYAHVPDLNRDEAKAFADFTRQQGSACLEAIEDWLEARRPARSRATRSKQVGISAGMHVFAYLGEAKTAYRREAGARQQRSTSSRAIRA